MAERSLSQGCCLPSHPRGSRKGPLSSNLLSHYFPKLGSKDKEEKGWFVHDTAASRQTCLLWMQVLCSYSQMCLISFLQPVRALGRCMWGSQTWEFVLGKTGSMAWVRSESHWHGSDPGGILAPLQNFFQVPLIERSHWKSMGERVQLRAGRKRREHMQDPKKYHGMHVLQGCDKPQSSSQLQGVWRAL